MNTGKGAAAAFEALSGMKPKRPIADLGAAGPGRPLVIYGAGAMAALIAAYLARRGLGAPALALDEAFFRPGAIPPGLRNLEIFSVRGLDAALSDYDLILGFEAAYYNPWPFLENKFQNSAAIYSPASLFNVETLKPDFFRARRREFEEFYGQLADDLSRSSLLAFLKAKLTYETADLAALVREPPYFLTDFWNFSDREAFFDGGAYNGDTLEAFLAAVQGRYDRLYAAEPDAANFANLENFAAGRRLDKAELFPVGLAAGQGRAAFADSCGSTSKFEAAGDPQRNYVALDSIDRLTGGGAVTMIKLDIEGGELEALRGAAETIRRQRPKLAVCAYHRAEDLLTLPGYIKELVPDYKLYFRLHLPYPVDAVLYAAP